MFISQTHSTDSCECCNKCPRLNQPTSEKKTEPNDGLDSVVTSVIHKFVNRSKFGKQKYGTDLDRTDLSLYDWVVHAQEEHMDAILYLEKIKQQLNFTEATKK